MGDESTPVWRKNLEEYLSSVTNEERAVIAREQSELHIKEILQRLENNEITGGEAALEAVSVCDFWEIQIPRWARTEIARAWHRYKTLRPRFEGPLPDDPLNCWEGEESEPIPNSPPTLEEAFGIKRQMDKTRIAEVKKNEKAHKVYSVLSFIHQQGHSIDEFAFIVAGKLLAISGGLANRYYQIMLKEGLPKISSGERSKMATKSSFLATHISENWQKKITDIYKERYI